MNSPSSENFDKIARQLFLNLISNYSYILASSELKQFNVRHIYENHSIKRRIEILNETYSVDYGFSLFIYNLTNGEYNILYNVPHEHQDEDCNFLVKAHDELFSILEIVGLISGKYWKQLHKIYIQK
jgi:hypothetical protein